MFNIMLTTTSIVRPTVIGGCVCLDVLNSHTLKSDKSRPVVGQATVVVVDQPIVDMGWNKQAHQEHHCKSNNLRTVSPAISLKVLLDILISSLLLLQAEETALDNIKQRQTIIKWLQTKYRLM